MKYTANQNNRSDCIACATARPHLGTIPFRLSEEDPDGMQCILAMFDVSFDPTDDDICNSISKLYPMVKLDQVPPRVFVYPGNYTCFQRKGTGTGRLVENLTFEFCKNTIPVDEDQGGYEAKWFVNHTVARTDIWWLCGDMKLRPRLPANWIGSCTLVQILMPFQIITSEEIQKGRLSADSLRRTKRSLSDESLADLHRIKRTLPGGSFDSRIYIDSIGVPRGVPDEYKARNQVAAGLESFLFWWVTVNKNVDWINYIYYNQQRFINYTRDAIKGIADQIGPTSLMTWQNRMALDMLLAEKGGVCKMFGTYCCTFIPNNTAPDGSITKALEGLTSLSEELAENSGIDNAFTDWLESWFGKWSHLVSGLLISLAVVAAILVTCGCCCIPCIRGLLQRLIDASITKTMYLGVRPHDEDYEEML
ncbi:syncytin-B-like [Anomaloglossus baeobatrachus]|uniref:syncytin-B-like n=1 Tax=Anomaloglossus baeobatrachus TaxID=238106 RepID=UPI003F4FD7C9